MATSFISVAFSALASASFCSERLCFLPPFHILASLSSVSRKLSVFRPMSPVRNPFDSDDESDRSSTEVSANPFDDPKLNPQSKVSIPQKMKHHSVTDAANPFDDDDTVYNTQRKSFCDEDGDVNVDENKLTKRGQGKEQTRIHFRDRLSATGESALKRAQKAKDAGSIRASKVADGGVSQVSKMKESSQNVFKAKATHANAKKGIIDNRNGLDSETRNELFAGTLATKTIPVRYDDSQFRKQELEKRSTEELEGYALKKAEETTSTVDNCLRLAEDMKDKATVTLLSLNEQREQINRTHNLTLEIDHDLSTGEKLLGTLGGMFSKTWKPKKTRPITGPALSKNDSFKRRGHHLEQRVTLGLNKSNSRGRNNRITPSSNIQQTTQDKLDLEKMKQDDGLTALSNLLDELKVMSQDMGSEVASQNVALDNLDTDVDTLVVRVRGANRRAERLLHK